MDMEQQVTGDWIKTGHRKLGYIISTDDEEVTLPPHNRDMEVPDNLDTDIRDRQATRRLATSDGTPSWGSPKTDR